MGLLRLLTNPKVMGADVLKQPAAWRVYDRMRSDVRVGFAVEPPGLEQAWRSETRSARASHRQWTDAYLYAFARTRELRLVSFDKGVRHWGDMKTIVLT